MNISENTLGLILLSTGLIFFLAALITLKFPPKKINYFYGYRTKASMKNQKRWDIAQKHASNHMLRLGIILIVLGFISTYFNIQTTLGGVIALCFIVTGLLFLFYSTESRLKKLD